MLEDLNDDTFKDMKVKATADIKEAKEMLIKDEKFLKFCRVAAESLEDLLIHFRKNPSTHSLTIIIAGILLRGEQQWVLSINRRFDNDD